MVHQRRTMELYLNLHTSTICLVMRYKTRKTLAVVLNGAHVHICWMQVDLIGTIYVIDL